MTEINNHSHNPSHNNRSSKMFLWIILLWPVILCVKRIRFTPTCSNLLWFCHYLPSKSTYTFWIRIEKIWIVYYLSRYNSKISSIFLLISGKNLKECLENKDIGKLSRSSTTGESKGKKERKHSKVSDFSKIWINNTSDITLMWASRNLLNSSQGVRVCSKLGQIGPKWDKSGTF